MKFKVDLLLKQVDQGAAEVYYMQASSLAALFPLIDDLVAARRALLSTVAKVQGYRVMQIAETGLPSGKQRSFNKTALNWGGPADRLRDEEDVALLVRCEDSTENHMKSTHLRFLPDNMAVYEADGSWLLGEPLLTPFNAYKAVIESGPYYIREFDNNLNSNINSSIVDLVKFDEDGLMSVQLRTPIDNLQPGTKVKIVGYKGAFGRQINGMARALAQVASTVTLDKINCTYKNVQGPGAGASLFMESYTFWQITLCRTEGHTSHDTGRSFFVRRGRRSKRPPCLFTRAGAL